MKEENVPSQNLCLSPSLTLCSLPLFSGTLQPLVHPSPTRTTGDRERWSNLISNPVSQKTSPPRFSKRTLLLKRKLHLYAYVCARIFVCHTNIRVQVWKSGSSFQESALMVSPKLSLSKGLSVPQKGVFLRFTQVKKKKKK